MDVHPDDWSAEMSVEYQEYGREEDRDPGKALRHKQARNLYEKHLLQIRAEFFKSRCWPCIEQGMECNSGWPCDQCLMDENEHVCAYPPQFNLEKIPLPFYLLTKKDHQDLLDLATNWRRAANEHFEARVDFHSKWAGAWHIKDESDDPRTDQEGHLTKLNNIKQEICAISGRVIDHLAWRDKELYAERAKKEGIAAVTDVRVRYNACTNVSILEHEGQHRFPSMQPSNLRQKINRSDPQSTKHHKNLPWDD